MTPRHVIFVLPPGSGLARMDETGQLSRLTDHYFPSYMRSFPRLSVISAEKRDRSYERLVSGASIVTAPFDGYLGYLALSALDRRPPRPAVARLMQATAVVGTLRYPEAGIPLITTFGFRYSALARVLGRRGWAAMLRFIEHVAVRRSEVLIVTNRALAQYVRDIGARGEVVVIPNTVDCSLFFPAAEPPVGGPVLFVGRLTPEKDVATLIRAVARSRFASARQVLLVGDGPLRPQLVKLAESLHVDARFLGMVQHKRLPDLYRSASVFVLPSLSEGHPKALLEALACGVPPVVARNEGTTEVLAGVDEVPLFAARDADGLATILDRVLSDRGFARVLSERVRDHAVRQYSMEAHLLAEVRLTERIARTAT